MVNSLVKEYESHKDEKIYNSVMDIIVKNNMRIFQEVNENMLCAALEDLIRERLEREVNIKVNEVVKEKISFDGCRMDPVGNTCFILKRVTH